MITVQRILCPTDLSSESDEALRYTKEHNIDLICLGASGMNFSLGALFGSNVDRVLRQAPCPVLVARPVKPIQPGVAEHPELVAGTKL